MNLFPIIIPPFGNFHSAAHEKKGNQQISQYVGSVLVRTMSKRYFACRCIPSRALQSLTLSEHPNKYIVTATTHHKSNQNKMYVRMISPTSTNSLTREPTELLDCFPIWKDRKAVEESIGWLASACLLTARRRYIHRQQVLCRESYSWHFVGPLVCPLLVDALRIV